MKRLFTLLLLACSLVQTRAQTITGADMENWKTYSGTLERPDGWHSSDSLIKVYYTLTATPGFAARTSKSTTVKNGGAASAMLVTTVADTFPTILANSNIAFDMAAVLAGDYKYSFTSGTPVTKRIYYVHAFVQHASAGSSDIGEMAVLAIKNGIAPGGEDSVIGKGTVAITASSSFKKITAALTYTEATMIPDRLIVSFMPTTKTKPVAGTTLYVDDVTISDPTGIELPLVNSSDVKIYPNPAANQMHISLTHTEASQIAIYNMAGKCILTQALAAETDIPVATLAPGTYIYVISYTANGRRYYGSSFSKQ
ncbi:MAG TPA: T9SS type A sorting domain-containing protein [Chitinophagaceae bacterium]|nr:T9SS type A sorting domain-containing protein [Chitinophagaceae bacterium]